MKAKIHTSQLISPKKSRIDLNHFIYSLNERQHAKTMISQVKIYLDFNSLRIEKKLQPYFKITPLRLDWAILFHPRAGENIVHNPN